MSYAASSLRVGVFTVEDPVSSCSGRGSVAALSAVVSALDVCVSWGGVSLYRVVDGWCFMYKAGRKPFSVIQ